MIEVHDIPHGHTEEVSFPDLAVNTTGDSIVFVAPFNCRVEKVLLFPEAAVTGQATNNFVLGLIDRGVGGGGTTVLASTTFAAGTNLTATASNGFFFPTAPRVAAKGTVYELVRTQNNSGPASPRILVLTEYRGN